MVIANAPHSSTIQTGAGSAGRGDAYTSKPLAAATPSTTSPQASAASNTRKSALRTEEASHWQAMNTAHASMPIHAHPCPVLQTTTNQVAW